MGMYHCARENITDFSCTHRLCFAHVDPNPANCPYSCNECFFACR